MRHGDARLGDEQRVLAASVSSVELVGADGELATLRRGDAGFAGAVVALGALGVVTRLTLDLIPTYDVRQTVVEGLRSFDDVPEALAAAYSVSLFTYFAGAGFEQVWVKQRADEPALPDGWLGTRPADGPRHMVRGVDPASCTPQLGTTGPWYTRLPHFRLDFTPSSGDELQSEYLVPRAAVVPALRAVDAIRDRIAPVLHVAEIRSMAADDQWLSAAQGRDSAALALHLDLRRGRGAARRHGRGGGARRAGRAPALGQGVHDAAGAARAAVAAPARLRRGHPRRRPRRQVPQRVPGPPPPGLMPCRLGPMLWPSSQMG